ncbi:glycoside hydrolase family 30 protein [Dictyobacter formicarum]|uniref:glycoside hydrolase family 30 protein n=1 Tax=Dictyobacter formicarum TaxID=2778368 RepID=UPI0019154F28|nr:glycoside hydrolase family 30 beta sandwich domain-containing protein [Dictyobacter formicarum]
MAHKKAALDAHIPAQVVLTTTDKANKLTPQSNINFAKGDSSEGTVVTVNEHQTYQSITGFGASFNASSVWELEHKLPQAQRDVVMKQLFDPENGIGIDMLRQPIGASDQNAPDQIVPYGACSYDDNNGIPDDANLSHFSIDPDVSSHTIALLQQARKLNPQLKILAVPWCIPQWMLTGTGYARTLNPAYYDLYARYLVKFIQAYQSQTPSIPIWGIIPQNEPAHSYANFGNNLTADQESTFIERSLGPALADAGLSTKILIYDHNWDIPEYPLQVLASPASKYVEGTSWHKYGGSYEAQSIVHNKYPNKGTFFTEDSPAAFSDTHWEWYIPEGANRIISVLRNWSQTYMQWTIASNTEHGPGSCTTCGADVYVNDQTGEVTYTSAYYLLGQFGKYIKPGAQRIDSTDMGSGKIRSVGFKNPDGSIVLTVYNDNGNKQTFGINWGGKNISYTLPAKAIVTFTWPAHS